MLDIQSLTVTYGKNLALGEISLQVAPGEVVALIGPNGAGKTTMIRAASGIVPIKSGSIQADGTNLASLSIPERARLLAVVPQARVLAGAFTVEHTVLLGRTAHLSWLGRAGESDYEITRQAMEQTHTIQLAKCKIAELSGGEQQRVLLARALAQDTPILLLDEPTSHLDLQHQGNLLNLVRKLAAEKQLAVLMAMHDLNLVSLFADRAALLMEGRILALGRPNEVLTEGNLHAAYGAGVQIIPHPKGEALLVLPEGRLNS
jgi:iron complex transport system ATP-binding protein